MSDTVLLTDDHPVDPDDELLVAYLDSELTDELRITVEQRLVAEVNFRSRLQALQTGWDWLDELPDESPSEKLVESTIELVVADIDPRRQKRQSWAKRHRRSITLAGLLTGGLLAGLATATVVQRVQLRNHLQDLAVAEDYQAYLLTKDFDFFRELASNPQWMTMMEARRRMGDQTDSGISLVRAIPLEQRAESLKELPSKTRGKLESRWSQFQRLEEPMKARARETAQRVHSELDQLALLDAMKGYQVWRETLTAELRDAIESPDALVRETAINDAIDITMMQMIRRSGDLLSDDDANDVYAYLSGLFAKRMDKSEGLRLSVERWKNWLEERGRDIRGVEPFQISLLLGIRDSSRRGRSSPPAGGANGGRPSKGPGGGGPGGGGPPPRLGPRNEQDEPEAAEKTNQTPPGSSRNSGRFTNDELLDIRYIVSIKALQDLEMLTAFPHPLEQSAAELDTLRMWAVESVHREQISRGDDGQRMIDRYTNMEGVEREALDLQEPYQIIEELSPVKRRGERSSSRR